MLGHPHPRWFSGQWRSCAGRVSTAFCRRVWGPGGLFKSRQNLLPCSGVSTHQSTESTRTCICDFSHANLWELMNWGIKVRREDRIPTALLMLIMLLLDLDMSSSIPHLPLFLPPMPFYTQELFTARPRCASGKPRACQSRQFSLPVSGSCLCCSHEK